MNDKLDVRQEISAEHSSSAAPALWMCLSTCYTLAAVSDTWTQLTVACQVTD
jgi:hypothetical protein